MQLAIRKKKPKIYFCDTGFVCWLLGIENTRQLHTHPQYGSIFETAVVVELRKRFLNSGRLPQLYYWRDNAQLEIDLIEETAEGPRPIEIKSGRTYRNEWSRPMRRWLKATGVSADSARIIYGGAIPQRDDGIAVVPWFMA